MSHKPSEPVTRHSPLDTLKAGDTVTAFGNDYTLIKAGKTGCIVAHGQRILTCPLSYITHVNGQPLPKAEQPERPPH